MRDGHAPEMARWLGVGVAHALGVETDLSVQTGASQSGLLLGSNDDIPAFRWVEKESGRIMTCSAPADCALIEERHSSGNGLLAHGGASRSNLLSGDADQVILTVSRMEAEKKANPGYRAYLADGYNVTADLRAVLLRGDPRALRRGAAAPARRPAARAPLAQLRVHARGPVRVRARLHRAQHHERHDDGRARRCTRASPATTRSRTTPAWNVRTRWRCCASWTSSSGASPARGSTRRGRTRSSSSRTTGRRRARRSCSATATGSTTWWSATCRAPAWRTWAPATRTTPPSPRPCARRRAGSRRTSTSIRSATARSSSWGPAISGSST